MARIDRKLYLIDGHHRLTAYQREGRPSILARVRESSRDEALMASKAVNCDGVKLPMHREQQREAAWQYIAMRTDRGRLALPAGESLRNIGGTFGVSKDTIGRMMRALPCVDPHTFSADACDAGTGWPQWRYVKGNAMRDAFSDVPEDARERARDERRAAKLGRMIDRDGLEPFLRSLRLLEVEAIAAAADRLAEANEATDEDY